MTGAIQTSGHTLARKISVHSNTSTSSERITLPVISLKEVAWHDRAGDCWLVVYDHVYDLTDFLWEHPGGEEILLEYAGRDATLAFRGIGHSNGLLKAISNYAVGILPENEVIYSPQGKLL